MTGSTHTRFDGIEESATFAIAALVKQMKAEGRSVANLGGGDPDFDTPAPIVAAAEEALRTGFTHYTPAPGIPDLREAIAEKLRRENALAHGADEIVVTPSAKYALVLALMAILDAGDEVLIPTPSWVSYDAMVRLIGAEPILIPLSGDDGFRLDPERLERAVTPRTRALLLNSPNNPTGRVLSRAEVDQAVALAAEHDLTIVSDEIYERIIYAGHEHISPGAHELGGGRTVTINGFSKTYAMTGWRLGYLAAPAPLAGLCVKAQMHTVGCPASFTQRAALAALELDPAAVDEMVDQYRQRQELLVQGLNGLDGVECAAPEGTFYALPRFDSDLTDGEEPSQWLLSNSGVATTPGPAFGPGGQERARFALTCSLDEVRVAVQRIADAAGAAR